MCASWFASLFGPTSCEQRRITNGHWCIFPKPFLASSIFLRRGFLEGSGAVSSSHLRNDCSKFWIEFFCLLAHLHEHAKYEYLYISPHIRSRVYLHNVKDADSTLFRHIFSAAVAIASRPSKYHRSTERHLRPIGSLPSVSA